MMGFKAPKKKRNAAEDKLCIDFCAHLETYFPRRKGILDWTHIANQGRSPSQGAKLKKMGVKAGWFDYEFMRFAEYARPVFLEAKVAPNDYSDTQLEFIRNTLEPMKIPYGKFYSVEEGHNLLVSFGIHPIVECTIFKKTDFSTKIEKHKAAFLLNMPPGRR